MVGPLEPSCPAQLIHIAGAHVPFTGCAKIQMASLKPVRPTPGLPAPSLAQASSSLPACPAVGSSASVERLILAVCR